MALSLILNVDIELYHGYLSIGLIYHDVYTKWIIAKPANLYKIEIHISLHILYKKMNYKFKSVVINPQNS